MSFSDESLQSKWVELLQKIDLIYENNVSLPFEIDLEKVQDIQDVFSHKSHLLENKLILKEIESIFIVLDMIEEKNKARISTLSSADGKETAAASSGNDGSLSPSDSVSDESNSEAKSVEDRRKKLLSSLPSQPRKLAEAAAAAAAAAAATSNIGGEVSSENKQNEMPKKDSYESPIETSKSQNTGASTRDHSLDFSMSDEEFSTGSSGRASGKNEDLTDAHSRNRRGISAYTNSYNPKSCHITVGSTVAYKPKLTSNGGSMKKKIPDDMADWFQCVVLKILNDEGTRYEIQDIEASESGLNTSIYKCNFREIIHIPLAKEAASKHQTLKNYPTGMKCLGRYPDTTTFYPAVVIGKKMVNEIWYSILRFDGEEEVDKETLVERQYVLQLPKK